MIVAELAWLVIDPADVAYVADDALPLNADAVTVPGNDVLPDPSNNVAVLVNVVNNPVYCLT